MPLPETPGHSQASLGHLLWCHCSFLLGPSAYRFCLCPQESVSPVLCTFWWFYDGINGDHLQEGLCHTQVYCTQSPCPCSRPLLTHTSTGDTQSSGSVCVGWVCVLCHSQFGRAQATKYFMSALSQVSHTSTSLVPSHASTSFVPAPHFPGCAVRAPSQICRMSPLES